jgi:hypothetical protein
VLLLALTPPASEAKPRPDRKTARRVQAPLQ